jgi:hypothetical protein
MVEYAVGSKGGFRIADVLMQLLDVKLPYLIGEDIVLAAADIGDPNLRYSAAETGSGGICCSGS